MILEIVLLSLAIMLIISVYLNISFRRKLSFLLSHIEELNSRKQSADIIHGKSWEQFVPFAKDFPFRRSTFRFIGTPIDGIAFEDGEVVLCEIKTGASALSAAQKKIKKLVEEGKVAFRELRY